MEQAVALATPRVISLTLLPPLTVQDIPASESTLAIHRGLDLADAPSVEPLAAAIDQAAEALADDPADPVKQWRLSLLQIAAGRFSEARQLSPAIVREARAVLGPAVAIAAASKAALSASGEVDGLAEPVEALRRTVRERGDLRITEVALCSRVTTFGVYEPLNTSVFLPFRRNRAVVYIALQNFMSERSGDRFRTLLRLRLELFAADGASLWVQERERIEDDARQRREDFFLAQIIEFPADVGPGDYVLKVTVTDELAQKTNEAAYPFTVEPMARP
jgi:hypothetical protein